MALTSLDLQVKEIAVGYGHYLAIGTDGALYSWGLNNHGQLGHGDKVNRSNPTKVGNKTDWTQIACGDYHSVALDSRGIAYGFGFNNNTQAGVGEGIGNNHTGIGGTSSRSDILTPTAGFRTGGDINARGGQYLGPVLFVKAAANVTIIDYVNPGSPDDIYGYGGTWAYGNSFLFDQYPAGSSGKIEELVIAHGRRISGQRQLVNIDKCEVGRNFIAATSGGSQIYVRGTLPLSIAAGDDQNFHNFMILPLDWNAGSGSHFFTFTRRGGPLYTINTKQNFMTAQTIGYWLPMRRGDANRNLPLGETVAAGDYANPVDTNRYIDFGVGDDFILAIDSNNNLHGMTFATSSGTTIPSTSVGNFGVNIIRRLDTLNNPTDTRYVIHGMVLLDSSRVWTKVSCGANHAIVSDRDGNVFSMGNNRYGQLGRSYNNTGDITTIAQLQAPANVPGFKLHACGEQASLVAKNN